MFTTKLIEDVLGRTLFFQNKKITHCSIDSRKVSESGLFFAFKGEKVDGHDFVENLVSRDVICIGSEYLDLDSKNYLKVDNVLEFITELAIERRKQITSKVIAITGSSGKTSTRQLIVTMLKLSGLKVYATEGNYNNHLGLPLTILNSPNDADFIVLELGMNHSGEIADLTNIANPDISAINNIGTAHIGNFSSQKELAAAKLEVFDNTKGKIVADIDNDFIKEWVEKNREDKEIIVYNSKVAETVYSSFPEQPKYMVDNLICAENVVKAAINRIPGRKDVFRHLSLPGMRGEKKVIGKREFVVDCYNANPDSMMRSIEEFFEKFGKEQNKKLYLILGSMFELGDFSKKCIENL